MSRSFEQLKDELGRRVGPLLPDVPAAEFEQLIEMMAMLQHQRHAQRRRDRTADLRGPDDGPSPR